MNILESLLNAQGSGVQQQMGQRIGQQIGQQLGQQFGITASQTQAALGALLPALAGAVNQNMRAPGGLEGLLGALGNGQHGRYLEQPDLLGQPQTVQEGNGILGRWVAWVDSRAWPVRWAAAPQAASAAAPPLAAA